MTPARSLLVGAHGQVGAQMLRHLGLARALPTSHRPADRAWLPLNLAHLATPAQAAALLDPHPLDTIFCVAAMTNVEACQDQAELAHNTNARGPAALAAYARRLGIPFVFFSTEYVFDGRSGPYTEVDSTNPISVYGQSKLDGEHLVLDAHPDALILRTTVVYGPDDQHKNYLYSLMSNLNQRRTMRVPADQISTPTYNQDLVLAALHLVAARARGIFHICGPERLSRIEFANAVCDFLNLDRGLLQPLPTARLGQRAPRPLLAGLSITKLRQMYPSIRMRTLAEALADCAPDLRSFMSPRVAS